MNDAVGGYFELELMNRGSFLHEDGVLLNSGRNALEYVLCSLPGIRRIWLPYYTCSVVKEPIERLSITSLNYQIDINFEIATPLVLEEGDYLIYTNYFGIKDRYVQRLAAEYGDHLIVDNAQAWFAAPISGISTVYSPRKYFGIPDGGIAYCPYGIDDKQFEQDFSYERCSHLLKRIDKSAEDGYIDFKESNRSLAQQPIRRMSRLTRALLSSIDYEHVKNARRGNFDYLEKRLASTNLLALPEKGDFQCPMVYPYLTNRHHLRDKLNGNHIYVATYWNEVLNHVKPEMVESLLVQKLVPLPCDQRYDNNSMEIILSTILM